MAVTAAMVKDLRSATDAPMMDCKKALVECEGDFEKATEWLRKRGISKAAKKADRVASEGSLGLKVATTYASATLSEINSETDFVAKNESFISLLNTTLDQITEGSATTVDELMETSYEGDKFSEYFTQATAKIGEKIEVRRFVTLDAPENGAVNGYVHSNGKVGVVVAAQCDSSKTAELIAPTLKNIAMHAAAMKPKYLNASEVPAEVIAKEEEIAKAQLLKEGKPEKILDKIIPGKIKKFYTENTLVDQSFVMDDKVSVGDALTKEAKEHGGTAEIVAFVRYELGEGIEKKVDDFAAEVAAQMS